jgi:hypothetical protein
METAMKQRADAAAAAAEAKKITELSIFASLYNNNGKDKFNTLNNTKLEEAKSILSRYNKLHGFQRNSKKNSRIQNLRTRVKKYEANKKAAEKAVANGAAAEKADAKKAAAAGKVAAEKERLKGLLSGNKPISFMNRQRIKAQSHNKPLQDKLTAFNKKMNNKERNALMKLIDAKYGNNDVLKQNTPISFATRAKILSRRGNQPLQDALRLFNQRMKAQKKNNTLDALRGIELSASFNPEQMKNIKQKLNAYNAAHRGRPGWMNDKKVQEIRRMIKSTNAETASMTERERLLKLLNITKPPLKSIGVLNKRRIAQIIQQESIEVHEGQIGQFTEALRKYNNKAKANKAAANKNAANKATQRKFQINSQLNEYLKNYVNAATIKQRIPFNLNKDFKGWRKVANKEKLKRLNEKLRPIPVFNNAALRKAVQNHFSGVKPIYNKALLNAILAHPNMKLTNNQRAELTKAKPNGGGFFTRLFTRTKPPNAKPPNAKPPTGLSFFNRIFGRTKPANENPNFKPVKYLRNRYGRLVLNSQKKPTALPPPLGYVLKTVYNNNGKNPKTVYYKDPGALESQLEYKGMGPKPRLTGYYGPSGPIRNNYRYGPSGPIRNNYRYGPRRNNYRYGPNYGGGARVPSGGIVFAPKINVGAARIGAQTFGGTRVGGQQMGGSHVRTGNTGSTTLKTGNTGGARATTGNTGNAGRLAVSQPTSNGNRQLAATSEQLIRGAGGAEAVEKGIKALNAANGNVARAKAMSKLPNNTFTNIYAMGGPVAAKRLIESRRRRRTTGGRRVAQTKKRVARKPKKYIKLTPYQFKRLTEHIKKNNLRKVLIKEIAH